MNACHKKGYLAAGLTAVMLLVGLGCSGAAEQGGGPYAARVLPAPAIDIAPPSGALDPLVLKPEWFSAKSPAQEAEQALAQALSKYKRVALVFNPPIGGANHEHAILSLIKALSPDTSVLARGEGTIDTLLTEKGELPIRRSWEFSGATDILGRPVYIPQDHPLNTEWLEKKERLAGAEALVLVHAVRRDDDVERLLRKRTAVACPGASEGFASYRSVAQAHFKPLADAVNTPLAARYRERLKPLLPAWRDALGPDEDPNLDRWSTAAERTAARCRQAYRDYLARIASCLDAAACDRVPVLSLASEVSIALPDDADARIPPECPVQGSDYPAQVHAEAAAAAVEVASRIPDAWNAELAKLIALFDAETVTADWCKPRRGTSGASLESGVEAFASVSAPLPGGWRPAEGRVRVGSLGPSVRLARLDADQAPLKAWADRMRQGARGRSQCIPQERGAVGVMLVEVGSSAVTYSQIFFPEDILCIREAAGP